MIRQPLTPKQADEIWKAIDEDDEPRIPLPNTVLRNGQSIVVVTKGFVYERFVPWDDVTERAYRGKIDDQVLDMIDKGYEPIEQNVEDFPSPTR